MNVFHILWWLYLCVGWRCAVSSCPFPSGRPVNGQVIGSHPRPHKYLHYVLQEDWNLGYYKYLGHYKYLHQVLRENCNLVYYPSISCTYNWKQEICKIRALPKYWHHLKKASVKYVCAAEHMSNNIEIVHSSIAREAVNCFSNFVSHYVVLTLWNFSISQCHKEWPTVPQNWCRMQIRLSPQLVKACLS